MKKSREETTTMQKVARLMEGGTKATGPIPTIERDGYDRSSLSKLHIAAFQGNSDAKREINRLYEKKFSQKAAVN